MIGIYECTTALKSTHGREPPLTSVAIVRRMHSEPVFFLTALCSEANYP
jgi:hypothetical protein